MDERDVLQELIAYCEHQKLLLHGIYENYNNLKYDDTDLRYMLYDKREDIASIEIVIKALKNQIALKGGDAID